MANFMNKLRTWMRALIIIALLLILNYLYSFDLNAMGIIIFGLTLIALIVFVFLCIRYKNNETNKSCDNPSDNPVPRDAPTPGEKTAPERINEIQAELAKERETAAKRQDEWERAHGRLVTKISGVTYKNDDKTSRQKILKEAYKNDCDGTLGLENYEYNGEPAIHVLYNDQCIGNIPAKMVNKISDIIDRVTAVSLDVDRFVPEEDEFDEFGEESKKKNYIYYAEITFIYKK